LGRRKIYKKKKNEITPTNGVEKRGEGCREELRRDRDYDLVGATCRKPKTKMHMQRDLGRVEKSGMVWSESNWVLYVNGYKPRGHLQVGFRGKPWSQGGIPKM